MTRFLKSLITFPIGTRTETAAEKLERITSERRESFECERFRRNRQAHLKHRTPKLILVRSQIAGGC